MIASIRLENFRAIASLKLDLDLEAQTQDIPSDAARQPSLIVFYGGNAQGKTTILESFHLLLTGRSFRTSLLDQLIGSVDDSFLIRGRIERPGIGPPIFHQIGLSKKKKEKLRVSIDANRITSSMVLARLLPVQIIDHQSLQLILGEPAIRRRFLDWGVFHFESRYGAVFKTWQNSLTQRNAILKLMKRVGQSVEAELRAWTEAYITLSVQLTRMRTLYFDKFLRFLGDTTSNDDASPISVSVCHIPSIRSLELVLKSGFSFSADESDSHNVAIFREELESRRVYEITMGRTYSGPHKADILITADKQNAKDKFSRGQCKTAAAGLLSRQIAHLKTLNINSQTVVLVDDITAELDRSSAARMMVDLEACCSQLFITALAETKEDLPQFLQAVANRQSAKLFHVEQGRVCRIDSSF